MGAIGNIVVIGMLGLAAVIYTGSHATAQIAADTATNAAGRLSVLQVEGLAKQLINQYGFNVTPQMAAAIAVVESGDVNNIAAGVMTCDTRQEPQIGDASTGMMQTLLSTAQWLATSKGYTAYGVPTAQMLCTPQISMYFGLAYLDYLTTYGSAPQVNAFLSGQSELDGWVVQSYNAGPGNSSPAYLAKYNQAYDAIVYGGG